MGLELETLAINGQHPERLAELLGDRAHAGHVHPEALSRLRAGRK